MRLSLWTVEQSSLTEKGQAQFFSHWEAIDDDYFTVVIG